jgi:acetyl-CoA carboxylase carboxyl transferase subunit alpha
LIDKIVNEPVGGAHRDYEGMCATLKRALAESLRQFSGMSVKELLERRHERLMSYGKFKDTSQK